MKVTQVEIFDIECPKRPQWHPVLVRVHTDDGIVGLGEAGLAYDVGHSAAAHMVKNLAETFLIGWDPFRIEALWDRMFRESFWTLGGGTIIFAGMSAIDTALWDIKSRALGVPVYELLGGRMRDDLRCYASQMQFGWHGEAARLGHPDDYARAAREAVADGYDAVKVDPIMLDEDGNTVADRTKIFTPKEMRLFRDRMQAIRDAVGEDVDVILEVHSYPGATTAIQLAEGVADLGIMFFEEPVNYLNSRLHDKVAARAPMAIAGGERIYTRWGLRPYLEDQSLDVLQPDIGLTGGFTEAKKVCDYAQIYDVTVQAHVCGSPVATAAALQLEAAIPNFLIHEHHTYALKDWNRELCVQDPQPVNGRITVPDTPGLGIELNDAVVMRSPRIVVS